MKKKSDALAVTTKAPTRTEAQQNAQMALLPSVNAAMVMSAYQDNIAGKEVDLLTLVDGLRDCFVTAQAGDLATLEAMLIGQAMALQTIFTSLARRAQVQQQQKNLESFLSLALKAQAQSRATLQAVAELKYPRQIAFVKQANISNGPQQVNNGPAPTTTRAHAKEIQSEQNKLLEEQSDERTHLDAGTTPAASRSDPALEAVGAVQRPQKRSR